jgi:hypothetical protein
MVQIARNAETLISAEPAPNFLPPNRPDLRLLRLQSEFVKRPDQP